MTALTHTKSDLQGITLQVGLDENITRPPKSCSVSEGTNGRILKIASCVAGSGPGVIDITLDPNEHLDPDASYMVTFRDFESSTSKHVNVLTQLLPVAQLPALAPNKGWCFFSKIQQIFAGQLDPGQSRDGSDLYFTGQVTHSRGGEFQGTYDVKANLSGRCNMWNRVTLLGPSLDLKGGNDPNADPDSLNFSWLWDMRISPVTKFGTIRLKQMASLESTQDFAQRDFIYSADFRSIFRPWFLSTNKKVRAHFYPDGGVEVGKNIRGIIPAVDGKSIARPKVGTSAMLNFAFGANALQSISFETTYARRWPLISEVTFKKGKNAGFASVNIGTNPRDYVKESMNVDFTKFLGLTVSYEYGSLPPKFSFLDSKFTFGLNLKAAFQ